MNHKNTVRNHRFSLNLSSLSSLEDRMLMTDDRNEIPKSDCALLSRCPVPAEPAGWPVFGFVLRFEGEDGVRVVSLRVERKVESL